MRGDPNCLIELFVACFIFFPGNFLSELVVGTEAPQSVSPTQGSLSGTNFFRKVLENRSSRNPIQKTYRALGGPEVHRVVLICSLYHTALNTLTQLQLDILTGKT